MALSDSMAAYSDCYDYYERARNGKGIRILLPDDKQAGILRMRLNQARVLERRESMRIYDRTDPRYGKSENDKFRVAVRPVAEGEIGCWVYIEEWAQETLAIEDLE